MYNHYSGWDVGDFIVRQKLDFEEGSIVKYICRYKKKDGLQDLEKAKDYICRLIERQKETNYQENLNAKRNEEAARKAIQAHRRAEAANLGFKSDSTGVGATVPLFSSSDRQGTPREPESTAYAPICNPFSATNA